VIENVKACDWSDLNFKHFIGWIWNEIENHILEFQNLSNHMLDNDFTLRLKELYIKPPPYMRMKEAYIEGLILYTWFHGCQSLFCHNQSAIHKTLTSEQKACVRNHKQTEYYRAHSQCLWWKWV